MSQRKNSWIFIFGIAVGVGVTACVWLLTLPGAAITSPVPPQSYQDIHGWIGPSNGWVYKEDSAAQWLMAFFSIFATVVSVGALILVWRTFQQTRRGTEAAVQGVSDARKVGRAEASAYLSVEGGSYIRGPHSFHGTITVKNTGGTPASRPSLTIELAPRPTWRGGWLVPTGAITQPIAPKVLRKRFLQAGAHSNFQFYWLNDEIGSDNLALLESDRFHLTVSCLVEWRDVFGDRHHFKTDLSNQSEFADIPTDQILSSGRLHIRDLQS